MDPLTIAVGVVAFSGLGVAWRMRSRARRAEAEVNTLRSVLICQPAGRVALPNQRPWRISQPGPKQWMNSSTRSRGAIPTQRRPVDPTHRTDVDGR